jgi:D-threo-aldose 1-dehydrogenase
MKEVTDRHGITLRAAALAFCAAHPAVASVLVGARSADEVRDCAEQFATDIPAACWQELQDSGLLPSEEPS